jgi:diguanylate cyclase (GGDEF)-like protein
MREMFVRLGRIRAVAVITIVSILLSFTVTLLFKHYLHVIGIETPIGLLVAVIVPLAIAPSVSWIMIGLVLEVHGLEEEMRMLVTYDSLTGLLSRRAFLEQANYLCRFIKRKEIGFSILVIDLDSFKMINDRYGHSAGDRVLESFGKIVNHISRKSDLAGRIAGRMGGEEFAFLLPDTNSENAWIFAERLHKAVREIIIEENGTLIQYTISIGLTFFSQAVDIDRALALADRALYSAKENGRNQTVIYSVGPED